MTSFILILRPVAVNNEGKLRNAIKLSAAGDVIVVTGSFTISSTVKIEKSLAFISTSCFTLSFVGASPITWFGMRVVGGNTLEVSFDGLIFDGMSHERRAPAIYIVGRGKTEAGKGPRVSFNDVLMRGFHLIGLNGGVDITARGAAISANIGSTIAITSSHFADNYAVSLS
eukprot:jgi/Mesen1/1885/ME000143S00943